jgi:hypothetical protein
LVNLLCSGPCLEERCLFLRTFPFSTWNKRYEPFVKCAIEQILTVADHW